MSDTETLARIEDRLARIETRLVQLMFHAGVDPYTKTYDAPRDDPSWSWPERK